jgi:hypothetical protein
MRKYLNIKGGGTYSYYCDLNGEKTNLANYVYKSGLK